MKHAACLAAVALAAGTASAQSERNIQFRTIDFETNTIEIFNFGTTDEPLSGWRFCSHDDDQVRRYTSPLGLGAAIVPANGSITIHFDNDADPGDINQFNASAIGNFAGPFDRGPFAIQLYFPNPTTGTVQFGNGTLIADHVQWAIDGVDDASADDRSDEAENGGVWVDQEEWISTTAETLSIVLTDDTGGVLHSPANYDVNEPAEPCAADFNGDDIADFFDVQQFLAAFAAMDPAADLTMDGTFDFFDVQEFLSVFALGCP